MALDMVHDTQKVFRTILHCMSRPGTIESLKEVADRVTTSMESLPATFAAALTLLDREVSFAVIGANVKKTEELIAAYTMAAQKRLPEADYVFITKQATQEQIADVFQQVKIGTLEDPQQSATILLETEFSPGGKWSLEGPGIKTTRRISIHDASQWLAERDKLNKEFPIGIDMILVDGLSNVMCLPRTTAIKIREV